MKATVKFRRGLKQGSAAILSLALVACAAKPICDPVRIPVPIELPARIVVEPVPPELLREHEVMTGDDWLARCPQIAQHNTAELRACVEDKRLIRERGHSSE